MNAELMAELTDVLEACAEYFADREDADHDGERYIPNKAMTLRQDILNIQAKLDAAAPTPVVQEGRL